MPSGVKIRDDSMGTGRLAEKGSQVTIRFDLSLNRGDVLRTGEISTFTIGKRQVIPGLEYGVSGMRVGGRRRIRLSPHLAYRDRGVPGLIPPDAVLVFEVELLAVQESNTIGDRVE
jgi:FKBP-type peptidyl-prolyl cis-trans isomerase